MRHKEANKTDIRQKYNKVIKLSEEISQKRVKMYVFCFGTMPVKVGKRGIIQTV